MLFQLLNSKQPLLVVVVHFLVLLFSVLLHEYGHALAAISQGDRTPADQHGRFIWNPFHYFYGYGILLFLLTGYGMLGFVRFNPENFRHPVWSGVFVALSGVFGNLLLVFLGIALLIRMDVGVLSVCPKTISDGQEFMKLSMDTCLLMPKTIYLYVDAVRYMVYINLFLLFFNLLPIPPFDGFLALSFPFSRFANRVLRLKWVQNQWVFMLTCSVGGVFISFGTALILNTLFKIFLPT